MDRLSQIEAGLFKELFSVHAENLAAKGLVPRKGNLVDASFVEAPRQRSRMSARMERATVS